VRTFLLLALLALPAAAVPQMPGAPGSAAGQLPPALAAAPDVVLSARLGAPEQVTFEVAVQRAIDFNTSALIAVQEIVRAEGLMGQARSASLPLVVLGGSWTILDHDRVLNGRLVQPGQALQGTATATVPLVAASRWYSWAHAVEGIDVATLSEADVRRTVAITAARAYLTVVAAHRAIDVSESAVKVGRAHEDFAVARRKGGVGNELDVKRAEQERWAAEVQLQAAYSLLARGREALGVICGGNGPLDSTGVPEVKFYPDLAQAEQAVQGRQDVKAAAGRAELAGAVWKDSWSDWLPVVTGGVQGYVQTNAVDPTPPSGWVAQFLLTFPIFEGGLRPAQTKERGALAREAEEALQGVVRQARSEVRLSFEGMRYAYAGYDAARRGAESAVAALELANQAYRAGATSNLELIDAERRARDAATTAVIAEDAVRQANLDLLSAAGRFPP
jgi:outer membrane protein TolC